MIKKIFIALAVIVLIIVTAIFIYRHAIIQYFVEKVIRDNLPAFIKFNKIHFDFPNSTVSLDGLKVLNPPDFSSSYSLEIGSVSCKYKILGKFIPEGFEIRSLSINRPEITVERLKTDRINLVEMDSFIKGLPAKTAHSLLTKAEIASPPKVARNDGLAAGPISKKLSDIVKLPASFSIKNGSIAFLDRVPYDKPHLIMIDFVNGDVSIDFDDNYSKILSLAFTLEGNLNSENDAVIKWVASLNPATPRITMSNRFEVSGLDMLAFEPYYDTYSPFVFKRGRFSGTLVFDFNNGNIGSTNEIRLSNILFYVKPGYENSQMWEASVPDLMRYFTTTSGDVVFDFKLKGDMTHPTPYLGPISKRAITSMAIDKISSYAIDTVTKQGGDAAGQIGGKAKDYISLFKEMIKK